MGATAHRAVAVGAEERRRIDLEAHRTTEAGTGDRSVRHASTLAELTREPPRPPEHRALAGARSPPRAAARVMRLANESLHAHECRAGAKRAARRGSEFLALSPAWALLASSASMHRHLALRVLPLLVVFAAAGSRPWGFTCELASQCNSFNPCLSA